MQRYLIDHLRDAASRLYPSVALPDIQIEKPRQPEHGDAATNLALMLTKLVGKPPRVVAQELVDAMRVDADHITAMEIAGPGFINFRFSPTWLQQQLNHILETEDFGKSGLLAGKRYMVEFVSANPTGPLTVGHGRNAVLGDTVARLYEWAGASVTREYYFNNAGRQMRVLGESVHARYAQELGLDVALPEGGYEGEYIADIAHDLRTREGDGLASDPTNPKFKEAAEHLIFEDIKRTLDRLQIRMDTFFNEDDLYKDGSIETVLKKLRASDLAYDQDGAVWFRTTAFGKEKDTVLVKSTGEPTYRLPDIAYHVKKLERGFDVCVDVFGADHIATYPDVLSALDALGYDKSRIDVLIYQFVTIVKDGVPYKMSTRKANFVTLDELMDEVGADVTRFFFLMRSPGTHLEFDIAQAKEAGEKNPVFYLQYANARIHSILRKTEAAPSAEVSLAQLTHPAELKLLKTLADFPDAILSAAMSKEPHRLINYLNEAAVDFHKFYHDCRILGEEAGLAAARTRLLHGVARVMKNGLTVLGISAPEQM
jgi:arginyl-tRNA synthetase